jgi:sarcosine oxidase
VVVGAGAWGLPAGAELARRGHDVEVIDRHGVGNPLASSGGASRIWRLSHPHRHGVRLGLRAVDAWRRLESRTGAEILLECGLLWRGSSAVAVGESLAAEDVDLTWVEPAEVGRWMPGLVPDASAAVWQATAGSVLADRALAASARLLADSGGRLRVGPWVGGIDVAGETMSVELLDRPGGVRLDEAHADVVVLAPGPTAAPLLASVGVDLELSPVLEQVGYVSGVGGSTEWETWPCLVDAEGDGFGLYGLPTPGVGYKLGNDVPLRSLAPDDEDRTPDPEVVATLEAFVRRSLPRLQPHVTQSQVCAWTNSPDDWFVVDRVHDGRIVYACGDSGQGFKFSPLMGEMLADLVEGESPDADVEALSVARFRN